MSEAPILVIDDDEELCALLTDYLGREGYQVRSVTDGREGLAEAASGKYRMVLLDLMLPSMDGFEVMRELRKSSTAPVIMLTAKGDEVDRIVGLELGADDYLPKPFNPRELVARIKAVLRRTGENSLPAANKAAIPAANETNNVAANGAGAGAGKIAATNAAENPAGNGPETLTFGGLTLDLPGYRAALDGEELPLTVIEFSLLRELAKSAGRVLSRDDLMDRVRGREFESFDRSIDVHISHLRQKLGDHPRNPRFIRTVRSVGYMFMDNFDGAD